MSRFNYIHKYPNKSPQDEEFVKRVILDKKTRQKNKARPGGKAANSASPTATNRVWPEEDGFDMDGGVTLKSSEVLDFAEGVDSE
ncbi:MAG TPA: hypothetical protein GXZ65_05825 [Clostridiales bacterium]|jgi:hypothetical protein|nr:hypothetical protein [Clostridiales bacterium]